MYRQRYLRSKLCLAIRHEMGKPFVAQLDERTVMLG
jgi:hypothetical protein